MIIYNGFLQARKVLQSLKGTVEPPDLDQGHTANEEETSTATSGVKGTVRFREYVEVHTVKDQAISALNHIHSWTRIQDEIRARRLSMVQEARIRQKKLENQLKLEAKLHELEVNCVTASLLIFISVTIFITKFHVYFSLGFCT